MKMIKNITSNDFFREPPVITRSIVTQESVSRGTEIHKLIRIHSRAKQPRLINRRLCDQFTLIKCLFVTFLPFSVYVILIAVHEGKFI